MNKGGRLRVRFTADHCERHREINWCWTKNSLNPVLNNKCNFDIEHLLFWPLTGITFIIRLLKTIFNAILLMSPWQNKITFFFTFRKTAIEATLKGPVIIVEITVVIELRHRQSHREKWHRFGNIYTTLLVPTWHRLVSWIQSNMWLIYSWTQTCKSTEKIKCTSMSFSRTVTILFELLTTHETLTLVHQCKPQFGQGSFLVHLWCHT